MEIDLDDETVYLTLLDSGRELAAQSEDGRIIELLDFDEWMSTNAFEARPASPNSQLNLDASELSFRLNLAPVQGAIHIFKYNTHLTHSEEGRNFSHSNLFVFAP
ncbi:MAG: hypothetical protein VYC82_02695 [Verrucomicrobiota bacterium]|nr:hypothetical protein [Verrucomicrobiota bacterium]